MTYSRATNKGHVIHAAEFTKEEIAEALINGCDLEAESRAAVDQEVDRINREEATMQAIIYTKVPCPFCDRAKMLFAHKGIPYTEINAVENMDEMVARVTEATGQPPKTVPQIWLDDQYIGGFTELAQYIKAQG